MKKILVLGASGFMGTNLLQNLSKNSDYDVYGVIHKSYMKINYPGSKLFLTDLTTKEGVDHLFKNDFKYDVVIQAAAVTSGSKDITERPYIHVTDNVIMNSLLLQKCYEYGVKHFIFLSCGVSYQPSEIPLSETDLDLNKNISKQYFGVGWTKIYTEKLCEFYSNLGMKCTVIRHSNTIGPYDKYGSEKSHFFAANISKIVENTNSEEIIVWGEGNELRDLIYVDDVIDFIKLKIEEVIALNIFDIINISYGKSYSVNEIVDKIISISGRKVKRMNYISKPSIPISISISNNYAWRKYRWEPKVTIEESIAKCLLWYKFKYDEEKHSTVK